MDNHAAIRPLTVLCALSVAVMAFTLLFAGRKRPFIPPPFDPAVQTGVPMVPEGLGYQTLDAGPFRVALCAEIGTEGTEAVVYVTNPADNEVWLRLRILDEEGAVLAQTGLIRPGEYITSVPMHKLPEQGNSIILKIMAYEPGTYHSCGSVLLNTRMGNGACFSPVHPV